MSINFIQDKEQLEIMLQNEQAVLFVFVEWSVYPLMTRPKFKKTAERISSDYPNSQIGFYSVEEDAEFMAAWLERSNIEGLPGKYTMGWGSILWFQRGQVIHKLLRTQEVPEENLYQETIKAFGLEAGPLMTTLF